MARRPLPRILRSGSASITRSREMARTAADSATDVLHPLITVTRGLRLLAGAGRQKWAVTPKDRRGHVLFLVAACVLVVALIPYGPLLALVSVMGAAAWRGREHTPAKTRPGEAEAARLQALYEALVPHFSVADDPSPLFSHGGDWEDAFGTSYVFDGSGRLTRLQVNYPAYFTDGEAASRARVEQVLHAKSGRGREYHFAWNEEGNHLLMTVLDALPTTIAAQRFVTAPGETVLGFTDADAVRRTVPVRDGDSTRDASPVVWRTGARSTEPHLLAVGHPGSGATTLVRSLALQALQHGDVLVVEGGGNGEYGCLTGREGVLAVECGLTGALATLEWASHETERRLIAADRARQAGHPEPEDIRRPLWILLDRPSALGHLAAADGRPDPQELLRVPLRHGRAAGVTVVVADHFDGLDALTETVRTHTRARVVLGPATLEEVEAVLGSRPPTTPTPDVPPGRGYTRLGAGPVLRLQVPATPDPYDDATSEAHRQAVLDLLPGAPSPVDEGAAESDTAPAVVEQTAKEVDPSPAAVGQEAPEAGAAPAPHADALVAARAAAEG
ncbi:hypothetical protein [Streptomyces sp. B1I3]|uniref:hypothetical protein n=1 Tax=Streptomyces sp. B1I3 TaxID=3042264 RepID=UPI00278B5723|nr:hypothetical protein [Streptomyces sp. B1I3]MDQ0797591.1 hypothetical protein [Streptomyces sp. B1I3]